MTERAIGAPYPAHGSHLPVMCAIARSMGGVYGDVLEIGAGECSTPVLGYMTGMRSECVLTTIEHEQQWIPKPVHPRHTVSTIMHPPSGLTLGDWNWHVALIDGPSATRAEWVRFLKTPHAPHAWQEGTADRHGAPFWRADIIVVHDTEPQSSPSYNWDGCLRTSDGIAQHIWDPWWYIRTTVLISPAYAQEPETLAPLVEGLFKLRTKDGCLEAIEGYWPVPSVSQSVTSDEA